MQPHSLLDQILPILSAVRDDKEKHKRKPFAHFNSYIHNSKYREDWFKFRITALEKHVREMIDDKLNEAHG